MEQVNQGNVARRMNARLLLNNVAKFIFLARHTLWACRSCRSYSIVSCPKVSAGSILIS